MSDTTITAEKRKMFREDASFVVAHEKKNLERVGAAEAILLLLNALEQAEDYAEKLIYAVTDGNMSQTYDVQVVADEVSRIWQAYTDEKVAKSRAEAEANVARLTKGRDWLAGKCAMHCHDKDRDDILCSDDACDISSITCFGASACDWKEAARRSVADADSEVKG